MIEGFDVDARRHPCIGDDHVDLVNGKVRQQLIQMGFPADDSDR